MQTLSEIKSLLASRGLSPRHRFGQNFLHDHNQLRRLVTAANVKPGDVVLEVGPGTGTLTEALLEAGAAVIACEIDRDLAALLRERLGDRITLIEGDCLDGKHAINPAIVSAIGGRSFQLVANLPYNAATPLMINLLIDHPNCAGMFVTIQKEVADRLLAGPSTKDYGPLSIIAQAFARVELIGVVPPSCFWPVPEVTSAMVSVIPRAGIEASRHQGIKARGNRGGEEASPIDRRAFAKFITTLFTKRRKQLGSILGRDRALPEGVEPAMRPEELSVSRMIALHEIAGCR
jgi:16S rRNA (adenine1518-N6/adenine1519-N6)-dimethyltransferase